MDISDGNEQTITIPVQSQQQTQQSVDNQSQQMQIDTDDKDVNMQDSRQSAPPPSKPLQLPPINMIPTPSPSPPPPAATAKNNSKSQSPPSKRKKLSQKISDSSSKSQKQIVPSSAPVSETPVQTVTQPSTNVHDIDNHDSHDDEATDCETEKQPEIDHQQEEGHQNNTTSSAEQQSQAHDVDDDVEMSDEPDLVYTFQKILKQEGVEDKDKITLEDLIQLYGEDVEAPIPWYTEECKYITEDWPDNVGGLYQALVVALRFKWTLFDGLKKSQAELEDQIVKR